MSTSQEQKHEQHLPIRHAGRLVDLSGFDSSVLDVQCTVLASIKVSKIGDFDQNETD